MTFRFSLRNKIAIPIFIIIVIAILITASVITYVMELNLEKKYINHLNTTTVLKNREVVIFLDKIKFKLNYIYNSDDYKEYFKNLEEYKNNKNSYTYKNSLNYIKNKYSNYSGNDKNIITVNLVNKEGIILFSSTKKNQTLNYEGRNTLDIFNFEMNKEMTNSFYYSDILNKVENPDKKIILASTPINYNGEYLGVILLEIDWESIDNLLADTSGLSETGKTYMVSKDKVIVSGIKAIQNSQMSIFSDTRIINACLTEKVKQINNKYINYEGQYVIGVAEYVRDIDSCIVTEVSRFELTESITSIMFWYFLSGFLVFIPLYLAVTFFIKFVTRPLEKLETVANEVKNGNLDIEVELEKTGDEIELLTSAFKEMLYKVRETDKEIRKQVLKQTRKIIDHQTETERLNMELEKFKQAVDNASDYITILDWNANIIYVNKSFQKDLGYTFDEIINQKACEVCRKPSGGKKINNTWSELREKKEPVVREFILIKKDGSKIVSEAYITPILNEKGKVIFYLLVEHDITKEKEVEQMKAEFLSIASHELRTPMTVIKGYSALLLEERFGKINEDQRKYLDTIKNNSSNLIHIVNDMLDIGKLEADKMEINYEEFNLKEFIDEMTNYFTPMFTNKKIKLNGSSVASIINTDKGKLNQVLTNLVGNAFKFTPENGKVEIKVEKEGEKMKFSVKDSGIGIKKDDISKLFIKFSQIDSHLQREVSGTGLGLVICKLIVEKLGGTIGVESVEGKGSTFFFYLPV
ncbi:MAG: ATP-binding protein [Candidatus Gracilibacteria bacterium]|nr:ATP-binding protein [Candidatus Gracilibacteria bacterium]